MLYIIYDAGRLKSFLCNSTNWNFRLDEPTYPVGYKYNIKEITGWT